MLNQYAVLYPAMKKIIDLSDYQAVFTNSAEILDVISLPILDPAHMPVTRDLSASHRTLIQTWIKNGCPRGESQCLSNRSPQSRCSSGRAASGRRSARVARSLLGELESRSAIHTELIDLARLDLPVMRYRLATPTIRPPERPNSSAKLTRASGLLIVAPEYKNGYPGSLKNAIDYLEAGILRRKPIGIVTVSSGGFGGLNCLAQLRLVCLALGGVPIPVTLPVSKVDEAFDELGSLRDPSWPRAQPISR